MICNDVETWDILDNLICYNIDSNNGKLEVVQKKFFSSDPPQQETMKGLFLKCFKWLIVLSRIF